MVSFCSIVLPPVVSIVSDKEIKVKLGERVEIHCCAAGLGADNFIYQWFLNGFPVAGQNSSTLIISVVSEVNTGEYQCSVSNEYHSTGRSEVVTLGLGNSCLHY